jgi:hypothetical protein
MQATPILETRGIIIKEERLRALNSNVLPNTLVLESTEALPGYFGKNIPDLEKPRSVYLILDKKYDGLFLARKLKYISELKTHKCYGAFGYLIINNKTFYCIRIKNLDCFESVPEIQQALIDLEIRMMKHHNLDDYAIIHIHKSFLISSIEKDIYKDQFEADRYYLKISREMKWHEFKKITGIVKSNLEYSMFDAALGAIWTINGLMDIIRIYDQKHDLNRLITIRQKYEAEIKRWTENKLFDDSTSTELTETE